MTSRQNAKYLFIYFYDGLAFVFCVIFEINWRLLFVIQNEIGVQWRSYDLTENLWRVFDMIKHIHILGASGSGTSTLGAALASHSGYTHFDTDRYYWMPTHPPFQIPREKEERIHMLQYDLKSTEKWVLTGSLCGWGDVFIPLFELVVYLWIPSDVRMKRLLQREKERYGIDAIRPGGTRHQEYKDFMRWAARYDEGDINLRSKTMHEQWLAALNCPILRFEGDISTEDRVQRIETVLINQNRNGIDVEKLLR